MGIEFYKGSKYFVLRDDSDDELWQRMGLPVSRIFCSETMAQEGIEAYLLVNEMLENADFRNLFRKFRQEQIKKNRIA